MKIILLLLLFLTERSDKIFNDLGFDISIPRFILFFVLVVLAFYLFTRKPGLRGDVVLNRAGGALVVFFVISFISSTLGPDFIYSLKRWLHFLTLCIPVILACFFLPVKGVRHVKWSVDLYVKFFYTIQLSLVFAFVFFVYQQVTHDLLQRVEYRSLFGFQFYRINSFFPDPNFLAAFLAFCTPFFVPNKFKGLFKLKAIIFLIIIGYMLVFSGSRGGILAAVAGIAFKLILSNPRPSFLNRIVLYSSAFIPLFLVLFSFFGFNELVAGLYLHDDESLSGLSRAITWYAGINIFIENPLLGVGLGNFIMFDKSSFISAGMVESWRLNNLEGLAAHSNYLEILTATGVGGFVFWLSFNCYLVKIILDKSRSEFYSVSLGAAILTFNIACSLASYFPVWYFLSLALYISTAQRLNLSK